jgi:hypothetical protein
MTLRELRAKIAFAIFPEARDLIALLAKENVDDKIEIGKQHVLVRKLKDSLECVRKVEARYQIYVN